MKAGKVTGLTSEFDIRRNTFARNLINVILILGFTHLLKANTVREPH